MRALHVLLLITAVVAVPPALADGGFFPPARPGAPALPLGEPGQEAVICHDGARQVMALRVRYQGPLDQFGWIIPTPAQPQVDLETKDPFAESARLVFELMSARHEALRRGTGELTFGPARPVPAPRPVRVLETKVVGDYEIAVLAADEARSLVAWLEANRYAVSAVATPILARYIAEGWSFVAIKVRVAAGTADLKPLRIAFDTPQPVFPLRISAVNAGVTQVRLQVWTSPPARSLEATSGGGAVVFPTGDARSWRMSPSHPLLALADHVAIRPFRGGPSSWQFESELGNGPLATGDLTALDRCTALKHGAPAFWARAQLEGAELAVYEGLFAPEAMVADLWLPCARNTIEFARGHRDNGDINIAASDIGLPSVALRAHSLTAALAVGDAQLGDAALLAAARGDVRRIEPSLRAQLLSYAVRRGESASGELQDAIRHLLVAADYRGFAAVYRIWTELEDPKTQQPMWTSHRFPLAEMLRSGGLSASAKERLLEMARDSGGLARSALLAVDWLAPESMKAVDRRTLAEAEAERVLADLELQRESWDEQVADDAGGLDSEVQAIASMPWECEVTAAVVGQGPLRERALALGRQWASRVPAWIRATIGERVNEQGEVERVRGSALGAFVLYQQLEGSPFLDASQRAASDAAMLELAEAWTHALRDPDMSWTWIDQYPLLYLVRERSANPAASRRAAYWIALAEQACAAVREQERLRAAGSVR